MGPLSASGGSSEDRWLGPPGPKASCGLSNDLGRRLFSWPLGVSVTRRELSYFLSFTSKYRIVAG